MHNYLELHRQSDDLVYQFDKKLHPISGKIGYRRRDQEVWITYRTELGWIVYDEESGEVRGRPWDIFSQDQNPNYPPEGEWVSKKGIKSYVYVLKYSDSENC